MLEAGKGHDPLLKRAFSLFRITADGFQVLYRIRGKGTAAIKGLKPGDQLDVLGPLGNHYPAPQTGRIPVVIAGGIGIASVFSLIEKLAKKAYVFYGARTKDELLMLNELGTLSRELHISTDDGSAGSRGTIVKALEDFFAGNAELSAKGVLYSCGPMPMLRGVAGVASEKSLKAYVSLEEHMACGIGACLGCAVGVKEGRPGAGKKGMKTVYKKVCKDGPVFASEDIVW